MKKQKVMSQVKWQGKKKTNRKTTKRSGNRQPFRKKEFRVMIVKMSQDLRQTMQKMQEMFTKNLGELKRNRNPYILTCSCQPCGYQKAIINEGKFRISVCFPIMHVDMVVTAGPRAWLLWFRGPSTIIYYSG